MKLHRTTVVIAACGALAFGAAACGDDGDEETSGSTGGASAQAEGSGSGSGGGKEVDYGSLGGSIRIDGSSTVQPVAEAASELFGEEASGVQISVGGVGTGDGIQRFCRGELQIADASRGIEADEIAECKKGGIEAVEVQVGTDGLTVVANKDLKLPDNCISVENLKKLLDPKSRIGNYNELGAGFPDQSVEFFTPGTESGTYDFFTETVLETDAEQRTDKVQTSPDDNQIITGIEGTKGALGYVGFAFADKQKDKLQILSVDGGDGCVAPSIETIADGTYKPLSRPLFMYPSTKSIAKPEVKGFLQFVLNENQQILEAADYVALTDEQKTKSQAALDSPKPVTAPAEPAQ